MFTAVVQLRFILQSVHTCGNTEVTEVSFLSQLFLQVIIFYFWMFSEHSFKCLNVFFPTDVQTTSHFANMFREQLKGTTKLDKRPTKMFLCK